MPNNGREIEAHSATNAWGCNLNGDASSLGDTSLISPAFELTGGNKATLSFWQSYDFNPRSVSDIQEYGEVRISTNNGASWAVLTQFAEASNGWEPVEIDLTSYLGRVIRLSWYYRLFSLENIPRPGWLVDDVALAVTNIPLSTIEITNNLSQASFTVSGSITKSGQGWHLLITNAPIGQYVITFKPVPYYQSPEPVTNTLEASSILLFTGLYTFVDTNANGIPDDWEMAFLGNIDPVHPPSTDSDGDGASDYAEFMAGTDPANPDSCLRLAEPVYQTNGAVRLQWPSTPRCSYRVEASTNAQQWVGISDWIRALSPNTTLSLPGISNGPSTFYRLEVRP